MNLKETVEETFFSIITEYKLKISNVNDKEVLLIGQNFTVYISCHFAEIFVHIKKEKDNIPIKPLLWAYCLNKVNFKNIPKTIYPPYMKMENIVKYNLFLQCNYIGLFCKELLLGDFSNMQLYIERSETILKEINNFYEKN